MEKVVPQLYINDKNSPSTIHINTYVEFQQLVAKDSSLYGFLGILSLVGLVVCFLKSSSCFQTGIFAEQAKI